MPAFKFVTKDLREKGGLEFSGSVAPEEYAGESAFGEAALRGPCVVRLEFSVGAQDILLEGRVEGEWTLPCSRCLAPHAAPFSGELEETYPVSLEEIDASEELRQALVLSLPDRSLCREDCKGLCPRCGQNLNQGPCRCAPEPEPEKRTLGTASRKHRGRGPI